MRKRWSRLLDRLGFSRGGRAVFTLAAALGLGLVVADDLVPRSGSEADAGPNVAAVVTVYVVLVLGGIAAIDAAYRFVRDAVRRLR